MAPRDDDKVMAGMLRRTLASSSGRDAANAANVCPPADVLAAYYERSLGDDEIARYDVHFSQCARCREQLAAMVRAEEAPQPKATWAWLWSPYMLTPAVAVLALAVFFGVHRSAQTTAINQPSSAPLVAMSRADQSTSQNEVAPALPAPVEAPPKPALSRMQTEPSDSAERDSLAKTKQLAPLPAPTAPPSALADKKDVPLNGRNVDEIQRSVDNGIGQRNDAAPQSVNQTVEVTAAAPLVQADQSAAPSRKETSPATPQAPVPSPSASGGGASGAMVAGNVGGSNTTAETVNRAQTQAPAAMSRFATAAKSSTAQLASNTSPQKIVQTPNSKVMWRPADGGFVERSPDGGATWEGQPLPGLTGEISAGSSPTPKICWLVGSAGTIFMTKDAANWKKISPPVTADFSAVDAKDASNATVTAADGRQFQTTDGGKHWKPLP